MSSSTPAPTPTLLQDYQEPCYLIQETYLDIQLFKEHTLVLGILRIQQEDTQQDLILNGCNLELLEISINEKILEPKFYQKQEQQLIIKKEALKNQFILKTRCKIFPQNNKALEGLYKSEGMFCTQNEPEGFRNITYFIDRPDIMSIFTTRLEACKEKYPLLLSNGNKTDFGECENNRHYTVWHDPFKKPSYLFAMVAGNLACTRDNYTTSINNKKITLEIYVDKGNEHRTQYALDSLKRAMLWDEEKFGLEYDLDTYMIVAVNDFNMGAMENKGLNIFNSACVLANEKTSTDSDFINIESIIAHEYFHNWTGNRVTCRDWFQLTLKEGLTVFRDQEFTADFHSRSMARLQDFTYMQSVQFVEDAGTMAHPIKPKSYMQINNFYTATVYRKGAEVIRMYESLIGKELFYNKVHQYCQKFDGQAITTEDFLNTILENTNIDKEHFSKWYDWAKTPELHIQIEQNLEEKNLSLTIKQSCKKTKNEIGEKVFLLPINIEFFTKTGKKIPLEEKTLILDKKKQTWRFENINEPISPSLLRNFSAPVKLNYQYSLEQMITLVKYDDDAFSRYNASQELFIKEINTLLETKGKALSSHIEQLFGFLLTEQKNKGLISKLLTLPDLESFALKNENYNFTEISKVKEFICYKIAQKHENLLLEIYRQNQEEKFSISQESMEKRQLKNTCLTYLMKLEKNQYYQLALQQFEQASTMEDKLCALRCLSQTTAPQKKIVIQKFYNEFKEDKVTINKWLAVQSGSKYSNIKTIQELMNNPCFQITNPNNIWAVIRVFFKNLLIFHGEDFDNNYQFLCKVIGKIDSFNPHVAARLIYAFQHYPYLDKKKQNSIEKQLKKLGLHIQSKDCKELIKNILTK